MPRLSLYKPEKGLDYKFVDRQISEMFQAGGTDLYWHKYLGSNNDPSMATADKPAYANTDPTNIQDLLLLENRDRTYDKEIYRVRGIYNVQNIDFNLSQFGLFIDNDTLFMEIHINDFVKYVGRKPITGDVIELPHLRDEFALNNLNIALPRYYSVEDVGRASNGFSSTWFAHIYRLKLKRIFDSQQFSQIFDAVATDENGDPTNQTLRDALSMYNQELAINDQVIAQAEADAAKSGYETRQFYSLAVDPDNGRTVIQTADQDTIDASIASQLASGVYGTATRTGYQGYLVGDGYPVNGLAFGFGIQFPSDPGADDFFLRLDFLPNRLFKFDGALNSWTAVEDAVRMSMTQTDTRSTLKTGFINNSQWTYNDVVATDFVTATAGQTVIRTQIDSTVSAPYLVFKLGAPVPNVTLIDFITADYNSLFSVYQYTDSHGQTSNKLQINLPIIDQVQQIIPYDGQWTITLYNYRESQRQSLSKALRPQADF
jgi:hypothetical protein